MPTVHEHTEEIPHYYESSGGLTYLHSTARFVCCDCWGCPTSQTYDFGAGRIVPPTPSKCQTCAKKPRESPSESTRSRRRTSPRRRRF